MLHFDKLTRNQEFEKFQMEREGRKRYALTWYHEFTEDDGYYHPDMERQIIARSNLYEDVLDTMLKNYKNYLASDPSHITDFETEEYYEITDFLSEDRRNLDSIRIDVKDLNKLAYMLQFFDIGKKTTKRTTKKAAATEQQDEA